MKKETATLLVGIWLALLLFVIVIDTISCNVERSEKVDNSDKNLVVYTVENGEMVEVKAIIVSTNGIERIIK